MVEMFTPPARYAACHRCVVGIEEVRPGRWWFASQGTAGGVGVVMVMGIGCARCREGHVVVEVVCARCVSVRGVKKTGKSKLWENVNFDDDGSSLIERNTGFLRKLWFFAFTGTLSQLTFSITTEHCLLRRLSRPRLQQR